MSDLSTILIALYLEPSNLAALQLGNKITIFFKPDISLGI